MKMADISPPENSRQICPDCNSPVPPGKKFCESCGAKIDAPLRCPQCGAPVSEGIKFCESCGASLGEPVEVKPPEIIPEIPGHAPVPGTIQDTTNSQLPKKPLPTMTLAIAGIVILIILALGAYVVVLPGLSGTGPSQNSGGSTPSPVIPAATGTAQGSSQSGGSSLVTGTLTPGPTDAVPPTLAVNFQAERDPISGIVTVTFTGGAGQNGVREVVSVLTRSDGQVVTKTFTLTQVGTSETLQGTKMTDRIQITAYYYNGNRYTVLDQIFEYKKR